MQAAWLRQMLSQRPELEWRWIDDDISVSVKELEANQLPKARCLQVSPKGAGTLGELRAGLERLNYGPVGLVIEIWQLG